MSEGLVETVYPPSKLLLLDKQFQCIDVGLSLLFRALALILKSLRTSFGSISLMESQEGSNYF